MRNLLQEVLCYTEELQDNFWGLETLYAAQGMKATQRTFKALHQKTRSLSYATLSLEQEKSV
jgi:hypothetical protein